MGEQIVLVFDGGEVMAPSVAVALRIQDHRIMLVDEAVNIDIEDVVIDCISHFPFALGEVPEQAVIDGPRLEVILAPQQRQFLFQ